MNLVSFWKRLRGKGVRSREGPGHRARPAQGWGRLTRLEPCHLHCVSLPSQVVGDAEGLSSFHSLGL